MTRSCSRSSASRRSSTRSRSSSARTESARWRGQAESDSPAPPPGRRASPSTSSANERNRMATVYREGNLDLLSGKVAVLGWGSQAHAHALNLQDSGVTVEVGLRDGSPSWSKAEAAGATVRTIPVAVAGAQIVAMLLPDQVQPEVWEKAVAPSIDPNAALLFAHGFNVHYGRIEPPAGHDVIMVAPKGPGHIVRRLFTEGYGTPALVAVAQDASRSE